MRASLPAQLIINTKGNRVVASYSEALLVAGGCRVVNFDLLVYLPVVVLL